MLLRTTATAATTQQARRPSTPPASGVHGLLDLQRCAGNAATTLAVQRLQTRDGPSTILQHPLLAGDPRIVAAANGRVLKQNAREPAVATMQKALELAGHQPRASMQPDGSFDGAWGGATTAAVRSFQADNGVRPVGGHEAGPKTFRALDTALLKRGGGGGGGGGGGEKPEPKPKPKPQPRPEVLNPALEAVFDRIMVQYTQLLRAQSLATSEFERDMRGGAEEKPASLAAALVGHAASVVFGKLYDKNVSKSLQNLIKSYVEPAKGFPETYAKTGVEKPFEDALSSVQKFLKDYSGLSGGPGGSSLSAFIAAHHLALIDSTLAIQTAFSAAKPHLRVFYGTEEAEFAANPARDARVRRAEVFLQGVEAGTEHARLLHYDEATRQWAIANAKASLDDTGPTAKDRHTHVENLKKSNFSGKHSVAGLLEVSFEYRFDPKAPVTPTEASITGLSKAVRGRLHRDPTLTIGKLGFPVRAIGGEGQGHRARIRVASDETRSDFKYVGDPKNGRAIKWLTDKGDGLWMIGVAALIRELDGTNLQSIGGLKAPTHTIV